MDGNSYTKNCRGSGDIEVLELGFWTTSITGFLGEQLVLGLYSPNCFPVSTLEGLWYYSVSAGKVFRVS